MVLIGPTGDETSYAIDGPDAPDLETIDWLATAHLCARRRGARIVVRDASEDLLALLDLAGLRGQMCGEPEGLEQPGVEEGVGFDDPAV